MTKTHLRIGTRASKLAMTQTRMVADAVRAHYPDMEIEIVEIHTSGEWAPAQGETRLSEAEGGKGLFAREIESALLEGAVDCGVHSMKDMASFLPDGLVIDHMLPREDTRDAFLSNDYKTLDELPAGATVGTSSLRRQAFILAKRPDLKVVPFRGNVPTRIEKLRSWKVDATLLALAGLKRLGLEDEVASVLSAEEMLPAAGQGAVGIETRVNDIETRQIFDRLHCRETGLRVAAERAALQVLDGSCHTPIGAHAVLSGNWMKLDVIVAAPDGRQLYAETRSDDIHAVSEAVALGQAAGQALKGRVDPAILS
ncbi:MAG: hydroxymethylbilane synthase [Rhodospirillales bacterium]|nr:hydroxymethylbilane synthase [Rhodospirillales bacterium]MCB9996407.1 hydroxymethylbilane synthase [Rhodospirillales bacterium]